MPGLRSTTLLFVLLLLAPAAILAFLGFRASSSLVQELRRAARDEAVRAAQDAAAALPVALAAAAIDDGRRLAAVAAQVRERLPMATAGAVLRALDAPGGGALVVRGSDGRAIAPAGPLAPRADGLPEWPRFCAVRARCDRGERGAPVADAAAALATPALRAAALALAWRDDAEAAAAALAPLPFPALAQAGPLAVGALARSTGGRPRLAAARADGALDDVPATEAARLGWLESAGAGEDELARQRLRALAEAGGAVLAASAPVVPGVRVEEWVSPAAWIDRCLPHDAGAPCALAAVRTDRLQPPRAPGPAAASVSVATPLGPVEVTATHRGIAAIEAAARRERWLTGAGIAMLLLTMVAGVALVRRALLRERRAAQLRDDFIANVSHDLRTPLTS
ncbi:MAG TPA: hypothetical protein VFA35_06815, partial [Burkholderiaceae bacterium]|nr:hypothetical protein [Burkholderiaceae bacterium]